jgi:hypothetical protein
MVRRRWLIGLCAGLFIATGIAILARPAHAAGALELRISAEQEVPGDTPVTQLKIEAICPLPGGGLLLGAGCTGTVECEFDRRLGPVKHPITSVTLNGNTLQFRSGAGLLEAEWDFGVAKTGEPNGQSLKAIVNVGGPPNTACRDANLPATYVFRASDTIKSEITNKP